jgi:hypothetical protein
MPNVPDGGRCTRESLPTGARHASVARDGDLACRDDDQACRDDELAWRDDDLAWRESRSSFAVDVAVVVVAAAEAKSGIGWRSIQATVTTVCHSYISSLLIFETLVWPSLANRSTADTTSRQ